MEYSKEFRVGPGLCRCCLSEGCYKEITNEYIWMGEKEIYAEMLKECFDICLKTYNIEADKALICEVCITRLRDASNFKKQVLNAESCMKAKCKGDFKEKFDNTVPAVNKEKEEQPETTASVVDDMKVESIDNEYKSEDESFMDTQFLDEAFDFDDPVKMLSEELQSELSETKRKKRTPVETKIKIRKKKKFNPDDAPTTSTRGTEIRSIEIYKQPELLTSHNIHGIIKDSLATLVLYSTAIPFKLLTANRFAGHGDTFICFYCDKQFLNQIDLHEHYQNLHNYKTENDFVKNFPSKFIFTKQINIEMSNLKCKLCSLPIRSLDELQIHLQEHKKQLDTRIFRPLKLNENVCQLCAKKCINLSALNLHHERTHSNDHIKLFYKHISEGMPCEYCGKVFPTESAVNQHRKIHETGVFPCNLCSKVFSTPIKRQAHKTYHHGARNNYCTVCKAVFKHYPLKRKHMFEVHNIIPKQTKIACDTCGKLCLDRGKLNQHIKKVHLKELNASCEVCNYRCFDNFELKRHMVCHSDAKDFECSVCKKRFARNKTMKAHMRTHVK